MGDCFDDCEELALQGAMVPLSAFPQALDHRIGHVLDREVHRHRGSIIEPQWEPLGPRLSTHACSSDAACPLSPVPCPLSPVPCPLSLFQNLCRYEALKNSPRL